MNFQNKETQTDTENTTDNKSRFVHFLSIVLRHLAELKVGIHLDEESNRNVAKIDEKLSDAPAILFGNHQSMYDLRLAYLLRQLENLKAAIVPMAEKWAVPNLDKKSSRFTAYFTKALGEGINVIFYPVPQRKRVDEYQNTVDTNGAENATDINKRTAKLIKDLDDEMKKSGFAFIIAPEGRRNNTLSQFRDSLAIECLKHPEAWVVSIATTYRGLKMYVRVGEPFLVKNEFEEELKLLQDLEKQNLSRDESREARHEIYDMVSDKLGRRLASMLPIELRGHYQKVD